MNESDMKSRTKEFAKKIIRLCRELPPTRQARLIEGQVFRAGTSVGANYRAACRGRSLADFISKLGISLEEADESGYWLELIGETNILPMEKIRPVLIEAGEIAAILNRSILTAKKNDSHGRQQQKS